MVTDTDTNMIALNIFHTLKRIFQLIPVEVVRWFCYRMVWRWNENTEEGIKTLNTDEKNNKIVSNAI